MREYQNIERSILVDMLSEETTRLTQLMSERNLDQEYINCKIMIEELAKEITFRSNTTQTYPDASFRRE
jgi:hypothetical protein